MAEVFTGLVAAMGHVESVRHQDAGLAVAVVSPLGQLELGESIGHAGICLTVVASTPQRHDVFVGAETLTVTTAGTWVPGTKLNLERALRAADRLGGHLVSGHVDGVGKVLVRNDEAGNLCLDVGLPANLLRYCIYKGSITIDGTSLTINRVEADRVSVALIPHTRHVTTLGLLRVGDIVNIEVDAMAKYVEKLVEPYKGAANES